MSTAYYWYAHWLPLCCMTCMLLLGAPYFTQSLSPITPVNYGVPLLLSCQALGIPGVQYSVRTVGSEVFACSSFVLVLLLQHHITTVSSHSADIFWMSLVVTLCVNYSYVAILGARGCIWVTSSWLVYNWFCLMSIASLCKCVDACILSRVGVCSGRGSLLARYYHRLFPVQTHKHCKPTLRSTLHTPVQPPIWLAADRLLRGSTSFKVTY